MNQEFIEFIFVSVEELFNFLIEFHIGNQYDRKSYNIIFIFNAFTIERI